MPRSYCSLQMRIVCVFQLLLPELCKYYPVYPPTGLVLPSPASVRTWQLEGCVLSMLKALATCSRLYVKFGFVCTNRPCTMHSWDAMTARKISHQRLACYFSFTLQTTVPLYLSSPLGQAIES
jgi:hypothetical protein